MHRHAATCGLMMLLLARTAQGGRPEWEAVRGRTIAAVQVQTNEVFDPAQPSTSNRVFHWANSLHVTTRPQVVRREFAQQEGDPFSPRLAEECERNLRLLYLFQDARVRVRPLGADSVHVDLYTVDRWTLDLSPVFKSQGGITEIGLRVGERNLLGLGIEIGFEGVYSTDVSQGSLYFRQRRFLGSFWEFGLGLAADDLGNAQSFDLSHPFYSDALRWSASARGELSTSDRRVFELGEESARYHTRHAAYEQSIAWHAGHDWLQRFAVFSTHRRERGDIEEDIGGAGLAWSLLRRDSRYAAELDRLGPDEEFTAGGLLQLAAGADLEALGGEGDRPFLRTDAGFARFLGDRGYLGMQLRVQGFLEDGSLHAGRATAETYGFLPTGARHRFAWCVGGDSFLDDLPYYRFALGSDTRLRGYEARALNGTRILFGSLEQRFFTSKRILFSRLGAVLFVDAAAAWDDGETLCRNKARLGAGFGLRLGGDPAGNAVTRVDLGFGTGSVQLSIASGPFFASARPLVHPPLDVFHR